MAVNSNDYDQIVMDLPDMRFLEAMLDSQTNRMLSIVEEMTTIFRDADNAPAWDEETAENLRPLVYGNLIKSCENCANKIRSVRGILGDTIDSYVSLVKQYNSGTSTNE